MPKAVQVAQTDRDWSHLFRRTLQVQHPLMFLVAFADRRVIVILNTCGDGMVQSEVCRGVLRKTQPARYAWTKPNSG